MQLKPGIKGKWNWDWVVINLKKKLFFFFFFFMIELEKDISVLGVGKINVTRNVGRAQGKEHWTSTMPVPCGVEMRLPCSAYDEAQNLGLDADLQLS